MNLRFNPPSSEKARALIVEMEKEYGREGLLFSLINAVVGGVSGGGVSGMDISSFSSLVSKLASLKTKYDL